MKALTDLFAEWMPHQRWFGGKGREWAEVTEDGFFLDRAHPVLSVHRVRVTYADGVKETYLVPLSPVISSAALTSPAASRVSATELDVAFSQSSFSSGAGSAGLASSNQ